MTRPRAVPEGIRITRVGLLYVLFTVVVGVAATNTGNNALYIVLALMLSLLGVSGVVSRENVRRLEVGLEPPDEIFAGSPFRLGFVLRNRHRWLAQRMLLFWVERRAGGRLVTRLGAGEAARGWLEMTVPRRGRHRLGSAHVDSIFPLGLFRKGMRYRVDRELLVLPRLLDEPPSELAGGGLPGDEASARAGWGHELLSLRPFRLGDDPRSVHWKQTARTGRMIFTERESEEGRRISIVFDNGVGELAGEAARERFERLVSEAATAAVAYLERGFDVELVTREATLGFGGGLRQRLRVLEHLALIEPGPAGGGPLLPELPTTPQLRVGGPGWLAAAGGDRREHAG